MKSDEADEFFDDMTKQKTGTERSDRGADIRAPAFFSYAAWHIAAEPTCEAEGLQYRICLDCGKRFEHERIAPYGHILGENGYSIAATCTENGIAVRNCRLCSAKMEETILPAPGHDFSDWMETKAPTVSEEGSEKRICAVCGHVESRAIEKKRLFDGMFGK